MGIYKSFVLTLTIMLASSLPEGFDYITNIDPTIIVSPRYAISGNFVG